MKYANRAKPAEDINTLLNYLDTLDRASSEEKYAYRGQTCENFFKERNNKEPPSPLLPSMYRFHWDAKEPAVTIKQDFTGFGDTFVKVNFPPKASEMVMLWIKTNALTQHFLLRKRHHITLHAKQQQKTNRRCKTTE